MISLISTLIIGFSIFLPLRYAFGISLAASFLFIVLNGTAIDSICYLVILGRLLISKTVNKNSTIDFDKFTYLFLFYLFVGILSTLVFQGQDASEYLRRIFITIVIILSFINIYKSKEDYDLFIKLCVIGLCLMLVHLYTQIILPINPFAEASVTIQGRVEPSGLSGQMVSPNTWSYSIVWLYGMIGSYWILYRNRYFYVSKTGRRKKILLTILLTIFIFPILGLLGSRSAFIVFVGVILILLLKLNFVKTIFFVLIIGILNSMLSIAPESKFNEYVETVSEDNPLKPLLVRFAYVEVDQKDSYKDSRRYLAEMGLQIYFDHPIFGVGLGNEKNMFRDPKYFGSAKVAHNTYLALMIELGFFGILFIIVLVIIWIKYLHLSFAWCITMMIGLYAAMHGIMLSSLPWVIMSFFYQMIKNLEKFRSLEVSSG